MKIKKLNEKNHEARRPQNDEKLKKKKDAAKQKDEKIWETEMRHWKNLM